MDIRYDEFWEMLSYIPRNLFILEAVSTSLRKKIDGKTDRIQTLLVEYTYSYFRNARSMTYL